ncbi:proline-rich protein 5-like isoform X2 [Gadus morhua]|uniref:proline-rich protein 5-like isoform X2 n=1 Tax=Gadus morhua TaxID=8049 RepID=UPI0011B7FFB1|nr:proline-rich protein 5-like isoform X2 [Gadus morhua]
MGSLRRPRARFMSSPVLSDLARFQNGSSALQLSNTSVWNRWLLKTELGSFITDFLQNQLLTKGLERLLEKIQFYDGNNQLTMLSEIWVRFFTETLPTLQAIFYPVQGQELTIRQMCLLAFRDQVLLQLALEETLGAAAGVPPPLTQMLLVLQGVQDPSGLGPQYLQLERLVEMGVSPYLGNVLRHGNQQQPDEGVGERPPQAGSQGSKGAEPPFARPDSDSLPPLMEQEGEAYLERAGGQRRHTVANAHSDLQLLTASSRMHAGGGGARENLRPIARHTGSEGGAEHGFGGRVKPAGHLRSAEMCCSRERVAAGEEP